MKTRPWMKAKGIFIFLCMIGVNAENIFNEEYTMFRSLSSGDTTAPGAIVSAGLTLDF